MLRRFVESCKVVQYIVPASRADADDVTGAAIDTSGFDRITFLLLTGTLGAGITVDFSVEESDASGSGFAAITGAAITQIAAGVDDSYCLVDVKLGGTSNRKRYVRGVLTIGGATNAALTAVAYILSEPHVEPVTQTATEVKVVG